MAVKAIRGATTVENNDANEILEETRNLLNEIINKNNLANTDIISAIFTLTHDLDAAFPAVAARQIGITDAALMCMNEINVPGSLQKCIRVMFHINSNNHDVKIKHIYLKGAAILRPDLKD